MGHPFAQPAEPPDPALVAATTRSFPPSSTGLPRSVPVLGRAGGDPLTPTSPRQQQFRGHDMTDLIDILVIGGGINLTPASRRDAAGRGLSVVLCEKGRPREGCSSRSGKLVHGGLRYLEYYSSGWCARR